MKELSQKSVAVDVQNVDKAFGTQRVLCDVSFNVKPGEIFVIMGPSGAGKSILLRNIIGLDSPDKGKILIDGLLASDPQTRKKVLIAIVFQSGALFNSMSVFDNLALFPREHHLYDDEAIIEEKVMRVLKTLSLEDAAEKMPSELSGGMKKRVSIARALMMEPQLLLYDEPTSELDPVMSANISEVIGTLKETFGVTTIVVSHDRDLAHAIGDRVALLFDGKIHAINTPKNLWASADPVIKAFLYPEINIHNPKFKRTPSYANPSN